MALILILLFLFQETLAFHIDHYEEDNRRRDNYHRNNPPHRPSPPPYGGRKRMFPIMPCWFDFIGSDAFTTAISNPYYPLIPGTVYTYEGIEDDEFISNNVTVTFDIKEIMGIKCVVVKDEVYKEGILEEETYDWFTQDQFGNVWYFGEDSRNMNEQGEIVNREGSWEAGINGAYPGIIMLSEDVIQLGDTYNQEYAPGIAEDKASVISFNQDISVPYNSYQNCLQTLEMTPLEPEVREYKYYARDIGFIKSVLIRGGFEVLELVSINKLPEPPLIYSYSYSI